MWRVFLLVLFFLFTACGPKQRVVFEKRIEPPTEKREVKKEAAREEKVVPETKTEKVTKVEKVEKVEKAEKIEKRETKGVQHGIASWYGGEFHGRPTSSGEIYDMYQLSCAHNTLTLGTMVIVTNLENGRSLELRVNDRGPFAKERIIDLSYGAARILGVYEKGTAFVRVETIGPWIEEIPRITLQVGAFTDEVRARGLAEQLRRSFENVYLASVETSTQIYHRVRIGPFETREAALPLAEKLSQMGFNVLVTGR